MLNSWVYEVGILALTACWLPKWNYCCIGLQWKVPIKTLVEVRGILLGQIVGHILKNYILYPILILNKKESFVWDFPSFHSKNVQFIWYILLLVLHICFAIHKWRKYFLVSKIGVWNISDSFKKPRGYWNNPDTFSSICYFLISDFHVWF